MRQGGGKSKGASFERSICVELSMWMSGGEYKDWYWRSAMSGGRTTVGRRKGLELNANAGDVSCVHPGGHAFTDKFLIECKHYRDLNLLSLFKDTSHGKLVEFWLETRREANASGRHPLLIAKQNMIPAMACMTTDGARLLLLEKRSLLTVPNLDLRIIPLFEFFKYAERPQ